MRYEQRTFNERRGVKICDKQHAKRFSLSEVPSRRTEGLHAKFGQWKMSLQSFSPVIFQLFFARAVFRAAPQLTVTLEEVVYLVVPISSRSKNCIHKQSGSCLENNCVRFLGSSFSNVDNMHS